MLWGSFGEEWRIRTREPLEIQHCGGKECADALWRLIEVDEAVAKAQSAIQTYDGHDPTKGRGIGGDVAAMLEKDGLGQEVEVVRSVV